MAGDSQTAEGFKNQANKLFKGMKNGYISRTAGSSNSMTGNPPLLLVVGCPAEKHYGAAVSLYSKAINIDTQNAVYYANRAFAHVKLEEYGSAVADASKAIEVDPSYAKVSAWQAMDVMTVKQLE
eukprot:GHRR01036227.1.p1 GENE.GHRR01036227.1~~GHRR01036227.1.p1  ORF type:complete len:125 (-),score=30.66 GHRR01036227.1:36-410(-)